MEVGSDPLAVFEQTLRGLRADSAKTTKTESSWTLAQAVAHCAQSIEYSMSGYPKLRSGLFRATIGPIVKRKFLRANKMSHDLTASVAGAPAIGDVSLDDARQRALAALAAFRSHAGPMAPHLAYGACTKSEYAALHLIHFQDHLQGLGVGSA